MSRINHKHLPPLILFPPFLLPPSPVSLLSLSLLTSLVSSYSHPFLFLLPPSPVSRLSPPSLLPYLYLLPLSPPFLPPNLSLPLFSVGTEFSTEYGCLYSLKGQTCGGQTSGSTKMNERRTVNYLSAFIQWIATNAISDIIFFGICLIFNACFL